MAGDGHSVIGSPAAPGPAPSIVSGSGGLDPYAWMRDREMPAMQDYLGAEPDEQVYLAPRNGPKGPYGIEP